MDINYFVGKVLNPQHCLHIKGGVKEDIHRRQYQTGTLLRRISEGTARVSMEISGGRIFLVKAERSF